MIVQAPVERRQPIFLAAPDYPSWGFAEVLGVGAFLIVAFFLGFFLVESAIKTLSLNVPRGISSVLAEMVGYAILFSVMWVLFLAHDKPLFESLGWVRQPLATAPLIATGVALSIGVVMMTIALHAPNIETPLQKMLTDRPTRLVVGLFGVTLAPVAEELLFRGFLQPVVMRFAGVFPGILITAVLFGAMHSQQYAMQWQLILGVSTVGFVLGVVRHLSGSTKASTIVHIAYNSVFFLAMLAAGDQAK